MSAHAKELIAEPSLEDIICVDEWARAEVDRIARSMPVLTSAINS